MLGWELRRSNLVVSHCELSKLHKDATITSSREGPFTNTSALLELNLDGKGKVQVDRG